MDKSEQRANQTIAEMERRFDETLIRLRQSAEANEEAALLAAFDVLLGKEDPDSQ